MYQYFIITETGNWSIWFQSNPQSALIAMTMGLLVADGHTTDRVQHIVREGTIHIYVPRPTSFTSLFGQLGPLGLGESFCPCPL